MFTGPTSAYTWTWTSATGAGTATHTATGITDSLLNIDRLQFDQTFVL